MFPIRTYYANITFSAGGCKDLHGALTYNEDGVPEIETCWKLSEEKLEHIRHTGRIYLYTMGSGIPPVMLSVVSKIEVSGGG